jgi:hypothetical protein
MELPDSRIARDIDALREQAPNTRWLYREACVLLFFRYGITPTANRLYQYVRKGSMSVPAEVLAQFWADLRERARVRIDRADLPEPLREAAGEWIQFLWSQAQQQAAQSFADSRLEHEARLAQTQEEARLARSASAQTDRAIEQLNEQVAALQAEVGALRAQLAGAQREAGLAAGEANALRVQLAIARSRVSRRPLGGVPPIPDSGQELLALDRNRSGGDVSGSTEG